MYATLRLTSIYENNSYKNVQCSSAYTIIHTKMSNALGFNTNIHTKMSNALGFNTNVQLEFKLRTTLHGLQHFTTLF